MVGCAIEVIDSSIVNVSLPHMQGSFSASLDEIAWVLTSYIVANSIMIPMTGWISARVGRKRYFLTSVCTFVAASALCGAARTLGEIVVFRLLQGLSGAAMIVVSVDRSEKHAVKYDQPQIENLVSHEISAPVHSYITGQPSIDRAEKNASLSDLRRNELIAWWAEIFQTPCVALDVETPEDAALLARAGADFVAVRLPRQVAPGAARELSAAMSAATRAGEGKP